MYIHASLNIYDVYMHVKIISIYYTCIHRYRYVYTQVGTDVCVCVCACVCVCVCAHVFGCETCVNIPDEASMALGRWAPFQELLQHRTRQGTPWRCS